MDTKCPPGSTNGERKNKTMTENFSYFSMFLYSQFSKVFLCCGRPCFRRDMLLVGSLKRWSSRVFYIWTKTINKDGGQFAQIHGKAIGLHLLNAFLLIRCVTSILLSFTLLHRVANRQTKGYVRSRKATDRHSVSEQTNDQVIGRRIYRFIYTFRISQSRTKLDDDDQE